LRIFYENKNKNLQDGTFKKENDEELRIVVAEKCMKQ
jgi:hypothetical protein